MNTRSLHILKRLSSGKPYQISELANDFDVSPRLIRYIVSDINYYLKSIDIHEIVISRNEGIQLLMNDDEKERLKQSVLELDNYTYSISSNERKCYILLSMWCCNDPFTSQYFADVLNVSKSSIDKDILAIRQELDGYDISIDVKAKKGSYIEGDERDIRICFYRMIEKNTDFDKFINFHDQPASFLEKAVYSFLFEKYLEGIQEVVEENENRNKKKLTYLSYKDLCIHLAIMLLRIELGHALELADEYQAEIIKTEGYEQAFYLCENLSKKFDLFIGKSERVYIAILLNGARYTAMQGYVMNDWINIQIMATALAAKVQEKLGIDFVSDEELINALTLHLGPTVFKLQNQVPVVNPNLTVVKKNYREVFMAVNESVTEIESLKGIGEDDIAYLTLHFCASLERNKRFKNEYNVMIVCVHSVGTASLMKEMICTRFKNIRVRKMVTRSDLRKEDLSGIDFIISSIDLEETICPIVKVHVILNDHDIQLIENVMEKIVHDPQKENSDSFMDRILEIVDSNCEILEKDKMIDELTSYFNELGLNPPLKSMLTLKDFLTKDKIKICDRLKDWQDAVSQAGEMLLKAGDINEEYIDSMIETVEESGTYMVIDKGIALVHGEMMRGVNHVSMSLLIVKEGVAFHHERFDPVYLILCLAAKDHITHAKALSNFLKFLENYQSGNRTDYFNIEYVLKQIKEVSQYD